MFSSSKLSWLQSNEKKINWNILDIVIRRSEQLEIWTLVLR